MEHWNIEFKKLIKIQDNKEIYDYMKYFVNVSYELYSSVYKHYNINKDTKLENILNMVIDLHNVVESKKAKSLKDIDNILDSDTLFDFAIKNKIIKEEYMFLNKRIKIYEYGISLSSRIIMEKFIPQKYKTQEKICFEVLNNKEIDENTTLGTMLGSSICYIKSLIKYIFLVNNYTLLINSHDELLIKYKTCINDKKMSVYDAIEQTYYDYIQYQQNKFDNILKFYDFGAVIHSKYLDTTF